MASEFIQVTYIGNKIDLKLNFIGIQCQSHLYLRTVFFLAYLVCFKSVMAFDVLNWTNKW